MVILTGANAEFYRCLCQLLLSIRRHHDATQCCVYDLGLDKQQATHLKMRFPEFTVRKFDVDRYPPHLQMAAETYAWKPVIIADELQECVQPLLWLDAATVVQSPLEVIESQILTKGQYVPISGNMQATVQRWTHPATLEKLGTPDGPVRLMRQRAGGICGFHGRNPVIRQLVGRWKDLSLQQDIISPTGANRSNHRQDQALLTLLLIEAEQGDGIQLTEDEIDVGSSHPIQWLSARNKVPNYLPVMLDPAVRLFYRVHKWNKQRQHRARQKHQRQSL